MRPVLIALLLLPLAGCLSSGPATAPIETTPALLPQESYDSYELIDLDFVATDGTYIHGTAYLPREPRVGATQADAFGTVLNFSPYYTNLYGVDTDGRLDRVASGDIALNQSSTGLFVAHGFAFVAASVPGTGQSGNCFDLGGRMEQIAMAEFVDWVGLQSWSNGNVGMYGASYDGTTQWMTAIHAPEALKTIVPWVSITDFYEYEYMDGSPYAWWGPFFLPYYLAEVGWNAGAYTLNPTFTAESLREDLCPGAADHFVEAEKTYATGVYDEWWHERNYEAYLGQIEASVFAIQGLQDWNVKPLHLDAAWDAIRTEKAFWMQQMQHNVPWRNSHNEDFIRRDYNATLLAWYDHYLNGVENGIPEAMPAVQTQDQTGDWRSANSWPPASTTQTLYLDTATLTGEEPTAGETIITTPPSAAANAGPGVGLRGPTAPDAVVAKFATAPLEEPMRIAGVPELALQLQVDRPGYSHIVALLYAHHADGAWEFLDFGTRGLAQREDREADQEVPPLEMLEVPVRFNPTDSLLPAGSRLVLLLSGEDVDWVHPNGNEPTFLIQHGSTLDLPIADASPGLSSLDMATSNPFWAPGVKEWALP